MHYHPLTDEDRKEMLASIGVDQFEDLLKDIPAALRQLSVRLPEPLSEIELQALFLELSKKNATTGNHLSFLGGGSYEHFVPAAVQSIVGRHEFYTAYTPYQAEASQGTLQSTYEFQSLVAELMGLDVSNASHYDGATSLVEAAILSLRHTGRHKILVAKSVHPQYRQVLQSYLSENSLLVEEFGFDPLFGFDRHDFFGKLTKDVAGVIFQSPNFFGTIEDLEDVATEVHGVGALMILAVNPISLGILRSPGEWGADIAVAEGQSLGLPLQFGGPYLGLFSTNRSLIRKIPGRLVGLTHDPQGRRAFCLTLQAREQHIRREKASSNICTNQALCALAACVYMTLLGKRGIREVGEINLDRANYLRERIGELRNFSVLDKQPIFNEFVVKATQDDVKIAEKLLKQKIFPGVRLSPFYPELKNHLLVCATETKTKEDLDRFAEALSRC